MVSPNSLNSCINTQRKKKTKTKTIQTDEGRADNSEGLKRFLLLFRVN